MSTALAFDDRFYTPISNVFGVNVESNAAVDQLRKIQQKLLESTAFGLRKEPLRQEIEDIYIECFEENWDGCDALPISKSTFDEAIKLIEGLPSSIPLPSASPEPSGEICLEWYSNPRCVFSISVGGLSTITYAGLFDYDDIHGTLYFGQSLPKTIVDNILRVK